MVRAGVDSIHCISPVKEVSKSQTRTPRLKYCVRSRVDQGEAVNDSPYGLQKAYLAGPRAVEVSLSLNEPRRPREDSVLSMIAFLAEGHETKIILESCQWCGPPPSHFQSVCHKQCPAAVSDSQQRMFSSQYSNSEEPHRANLGDPPNQMNRTSFGNPEISERARRIQNRNICTWSQYTI